MNKVNLLNVQVNNETKQEALAHMASLIEKGEACYGLFVNTDVIVKAERSQRLRWILTRVCHLPV